MKKYLFTILILSCLSIWYACTKTDKVSIAKTDLSISEAKSFFESHTFSTKKGNRSFPNAPVSIEKVDWRLVSSQSNIVG